MKIYDGGKILIGLIIFAALFASPFYLNMGKAVTKPELKFDTPEILRLEKETGKKECIESKEFMRTEHMQMLNIWKDAVVRDGKRLYTNVKGKDFNMSLNTCMKCHSNKEESCDQCHNYVAAKPHCWNCHIAPKEKKL